MKIINFLIISDTEENKVLLGDFIDKLSLLKSHTFVSSIEKAIYALSKQFPDILIIDLNSVSFKDIQAIYSAIPKNSLPLIVLSSNEHDAIESYEIGIATDFLLKKFTFERFEKAIKRVILGNITIQKKLEENYIFLKVSRLYKKFLFDEIISAEGYGIYSKLTTPRGKITINDSIMSLESKLPNKKFIRVHKSFIINIDKVVSIKSNALEMEIGEVSIGLNYKSAVINTFTVLQKREDAV